MCIDVGNVCGCGCAWVCVSSQVRSGQSVHSDHAVVAHACHGHRNRLGQDKKRGRSKGGPPALAGRREYEKSDRGR